MASISAYDKMSYGKVNLPTLQEMMVAPQYLEEQHNLALQESGKLSAEANMAATLAMENPNSKAAKSYQAYVADLNKATSALSEKGVQGSNIKAALSSARGRYTSEIMPIVQAGAVREKDLAVLNEAKMKDPTLLYNADPLAYSIDSYISRGNSSYIPDAISGTQLQEQVANKVKFLRDQFRQGGDKMFTKTNLPYEYMAKLDYGATPAEVEQAMVRDGYDAKEVNQMTAMLHGAIDTTLQANGVYDKFASNPGLIDQAWKFGAQGAYAAIGKSDTQFKSDTYSMQRTLIQDRERDSKSKVPGTPRAYRGVNILESDQQKTGQLQDSKEKLINAYKKYLDPNTRLYVSPEEKARLVAGEPFKGMNQQTGKTLAGKQGKDTSTIWSKSDYVKEMEKISKEVGYDPYGVADENGKRTLKPLSTIKQELDSYITNLSVLSRADALDFNSPEASRAFLAKISKDTDAFKDEKGKTVKIDKFIQTYKDSNNKFVKTIADGTEILSDPKTNKIIIKNVDGDVAYLDFNKFPDIAAPFKAFHKSYLDNLLGYQNSRTNQIYGYEANIEAMNNNLEEQGKSNQKIDLRKYNLDSTIDQMRLVQDVADRELTLKRDEYVPIFKQEYQNLTPSLKQHIKESEYIQQRLLEQKEELVYARQMRASQLDTTPITDVAVDALLKSTELKTEQVTF